MSGKKYLLFGGILRSWSPGRLVGRLRDRATESNDGADFFCGERASVGRHHRRFAHRAAAKRDDVLHEFVALGVQRGAVIQQRRHGSEIRAVRWPRRRGIRMAPNAILVEDALSLSLLITQWNHFRRIARIGLCIIRSEKRIDLSDFGVLATA